MAIQEVIDTALPDIRIPSFLAQSRNDGTTTGAINKPALKLGQGIWSLLSGDFSIQLLKRKFMRRLLITLAAVTAFFAMPGCASSGRQIEQANIQKIVIGTTTKQQMLEMFGPPLSQSYGTEGKLTMLWNYVYVGPFGTGMKLQNLAVLFDQQEHVEKYNLVDNSENGIRFGP